MVCFENKAGRRLGTPVTPSSPLAPVAWRPLIGFALLRIALYLFSSGPLAYGYMSDELYYLECADRLAWGMSITRHFPSLCLDSCVEYSGTHYLCCDWLPHSRAAER